MKYYLYLLCIIMVQSLFADSEVPVNQPLATDEKTTGVMEAARHFMVVAKSFQKIAQYDFDSALKARGTDAIKQKWAQEGGGIFDEPIDSASFFAHTIQLIGPMSINTGYIGYYNIWTDSMVTLRFETKNRETMAYDFVICKGGAYDTQKTFPLLSGGLSDVSDELQRRYKAAELKFISLFDTKGILIKENNADEIKEIKARLEKRVIEARRWLDPRYQDYSETEYYLLMSQVVAAIQLGEGDQAAGQINSQVLNALAPLLKLPAQWRFDLKLISFTVHGQNALAAFASFALPECLVFMEFEKTKGKPVLKDVLVTSVDERLTESPAVDRSEK